jgi:arylsulfatase A-like enzyme
MVMGWIDGLPKQQPYLLWVHYMGPHRFYANGGELARRVLDPGYTGNLAPRKEVFRRLSRSKQRLTPRDVEHLDAIYDASVMTTDQWIAELLDALEAAGRLERTLVVFFSDHGEELYDHNAYIYHSCSVYESTLHVPMGFVAPGLLEGGRSIAAPVELLDVAPTVLDLLGLPPLAEQQGASLVPLLDRPEAGGPTRAAFSEYGDSQLHTVFAGGWKLIDNPGGVTPRCDTPLPNGSYPIARSELYDLTADPGERRNLAARHPEKVAELQEQIRRRFSDGIDRSVPQQIPEDLKEELRALGYLVD